jgi:hypothetical protein
MTDNSKKAFFTIWTFILICFSIQFLGIASEMIKSSYQNIFSLLGVISLLILSLSIYVGYFISHLMIGPWLLAKHGRRNLKDSYLMMSNCLYAETELKDLRTVIDDPSIVKTLKLINFCKYSIIISLIMMVLFFILSN